MLPKTPKTPKTKSVATSPKIPAALLPKQPSIMGFIKKVEVLPQLSQLSRWSPANYQLDIYDVKRITPTKQPLNSFTQRNFAHKTYENQTPKNDISGPLRQALIQNNVDANTAQNCRKCLIAFFDTLAYYKFKQQPDQNLKMLKKQPVENQAFSSIELPGRVFFGLQAHEIDFLDPLKIYEEIDYEAATPLFVSDASDSSTTPSETSDVSDQENSEMNDLSENTLYQRLSPNTKRDADDIDVDDAMESKFRSLKQQKQLFELLSKKQAFFDYPTPQLCPEGISQAKGVLYVFEGQTESQNKKDVQILKSEVPKHLLPLFFDCGKNGSELQNCFADQDYVVEFEKEIDE